MFWSVNVSDVRVTSFLAATCLGTNGWSDPLLALTFEWSICSKMKIQFQDNQDLAFVHVCLYRSLYCSLRVYFVLLIHKQIFMGLYDLKLWYWASGLNSLNVNNSASRGYQFPCESEQFGDWLVVIFLDHFFFLPQIRSGAALNFLLSF